MTLQSESRGETRVSTAHVPLLKHGVMVWLQAAEERGNGRIHGDMYTMAAELKATPAHTRKVLYDLQKLGYVTFRERKHEGTDGHGATDVLVRFALTPKGKAWTADKGTLEDLTTVTTNMPEDLNPTFMEQAAIDEVAEDLQRERIVRAFTPETWRDKTYRYRAEGDAPIAALTRLLRGKPPMRIREANIALGYYPGSTALYALSKSNGGFTIKGGSISYTGGLDWVPTKEGSAHSGRPRLAPETPLVRETEASDEQRTDLPTLNGDDATSDAGTLTNLLPLGPELTALMQREAKRSKVQEAVVLLEAAGLEEDALNALSRIPDDTLQERETLALLHALGYGPRGEHDARDGD
jgi:hypothetical protein